MAITLQQLLKTMTDNGASDLHLSRGVPPLIRIDGALHRLVTDPLGEAETQALCATLLDEAQGEVLRRRGVLCLSFGVRGLGRFRASLYLQRGSYAAAIRRLPAAGQIPSAASLGLPAELLALCTRRPGLILVSGLAGSGRSTSAAALVDHFNAEQTGHIVTVEDPLEHLHEPRGCLVTQREVYGDAQSHGAALRGALRLDPDLLFLGDLRGARVIAEALRLCEEGPLVLGVVAGRSAAGALESLVDALPARQRQRALARLARGLLGVLHQALVPRRGGGRALAVEVLLGTGAVRGLVHEGRFAQLGAQMGTARMPTLNQALSALYHEQQIAMNDALERSPDPEALLPLLQQRGRAQPGAPLA